MFMKTKYIRNYPNGQSKCGEQRRPLVENVKLLSCVTNLSPRVLKSRFNSLPNDKILETSKLKAFADDKINVTQKLNFLFGKSRKHCEKRRKCWLPAFSPLPTMFSKACLLRVVKIWDCAGKELKNSNNQKGIPITCKACGYPSKRAILCEKGT